jgi:predicted nucleotidyltransferase
MRLSDLQVDAIKEIATACFGQASEVYLFGSRADDQRRGGDIDLYIEADVPQPEDRLDAKLKFLAQLKQRIGDQRIDLVIGSGAGGVRRSGIAEIAKRTGVRL